MLFSRGNRLLSCWAFFFIAGVAPLVRAQPANNDWANREVIAAFPFSDNETLIGTATSEASDPQQICRVGGPTAQAGNSVWYSYTTGASVEFISLSTATSNYDSIVSVYSGAPPNFSLVAGGCNDDGIAAVFQSRLNGLRLAPSTAYSIQVTRFTAGLSAATLNFAASASPQYLVNKTVDTNDGVCDADCSLREAIGTSNVSPGAVIVPAGNYLLTLAGSGENNNATGDLDVRAGMGVYGAGSALTVIDAGDLDRVLEVDAAIASNRVTFILSGVALTNGTAPSDGGGLLLAAPNDFLGIDNVAITNNVAMLNGGGLSSSGRGTLWNSIVAGNDAGSNGGGASLNGDQDSTFEIRNASVSLNQSLSTTTTGGGGVQSSMRLRIVNSTISGNSARLNGGGVIHTGLGSIALSSSTIANNTSDSDLNNSGSGGGIRLESSNVASEIINSIIANNVDNTSVPSHDCSRSAGTISSSFNHVETMGTCAFLMGAGDVTGSDPQIETALANNGGTSLTHAVLGSSPVIDAGNPAGCVDYLGATIAFDQRGTGFARAVDGNGDLSAICDKGAYEFVPVVLAAPGTPDLDAASDSGVSNTDNLTKATAPMFVGICPQDGANITVLIDAIAAAPTAVCTTGAYSIALASPPTEGVRFISATASSINGTSVASPTLSVNFDRTAPASPTITGPLIADAPSRAITGIGAEENGVTIRVFLNIIPVCTGTTSTAPSWDCLSFLGPGTYQLGASQNDLAGNNGSVVGSFAVTISASLFRDGFEAP